MINVYLNPLFLMSTLLLTWMYILYPLTLYLLNLNNEKHINENNLPEINLLLCTYNERNYIEKRINNILNLDYPKNKIDIIIVDSSDDGTFDFILHNYKDHLTIIKEDARLGKAHAINKGISECDKNIIILTDATVLFDEKALLNIVKPFYDEKVGVVTGKFQPIGGEKVFWSFKNIIKKLESGVDSTTFVSGDLCAIRKDVIDHIPIDTLCDDVNIALQSRKKGYKVVFEDQAIVYERVTESYNDFIIQKTRRAIGGIQETVRFYEMILNPRYGYFGLLIMPTRFMYNILNPIAITTFLLTLLYYFLKINVYFIFSLPIYIILNYVFSKHIIFSSVNNFLMTIFIQILALIKYLRKDYDVKWDKIGLFKKDIESY